MILSLFWSIMGGAHELTVEPVNSLTTVGYLREVFFRLWIPSLVRISTYAWS